MSIVHWIRDRSGTAGGFPLYCLKCGTYLPDEARFCWKCGSAVAVSVPPEDEVDYEYCRISESWEGDMYFFLASPESDEKKVIATSPKLKDPFGEDFLLENMFFSSMGFDQIRLPPEVTRLREEFLHQMVSRGWEKVLPDSYENYGLMRRVKRS
jgi:hypothetical protein